MKTTLKQFKFFKDECLKWKKKLKLSGLRIDFLFRDMDAQAEIDYSLEDHVATITLSKKLTWGETSSPRAVLVETAKHEMIHALIGVLSALATARYTTQKEVFREGECLVRKLSELIQ